jgi:glutamate---cysteine ligase / carboxylate-amine ligase
VIDDAGYLRLLGFPERHCRAGELWRHLIETSALDNSADWGEPLRVILEQGPLARRILRALGPACDKARLHAVYRALCDCLEAGRMFVD